MSAVSVRGLEKAFGDRLVLEGIAVEVESGAFVTLVGASGCGKTTFLRVLLGAERPSRGRVLVDGAPLPPEPDAGRGVVFQRYAVFPHLSVVDNVALGLEFRRSRRLGRLFGGAKRRAREEAAGILAEVGLGDVLDARPTALSGGMSQRLAIAQALVLKPRMLLLDEPFGALDPGTRLAMHDLLTRLWRETGMTVFLVTHDLAEAFRLGTRVLTLDKRRRDPHAPDAFGATITYDLPGRNRRAPPTPATGAAPAGRSPLPVPSTNEVSHA